MESSGVAVLGMYLPSSDSQWTPAERVRRQLQRFGWQSLGLSEQRWSLLDQTLHPHLYEWMQSEAIQGGEENVGSSTGVTHQLRTLPPALREFQSTPEELARILSEPYASLSRRDGIIRKLLTKYHDNSSAIQTQQMSTIHGYDKHAAARIRATQFEFLTREEREWSSIDKILDPAVWSWYRGQNHSNVTANHSNGVCYARCPTQ